MWWDERFVDFDGDVNAQESASSGPGSRDTDLTAIVALENDYTRYMCCQLSLLQYKGSDLSSRPIYLVSRTIATELAWLSPAGSRYSPLSTVAGNGR